LFLYTYGDRRVLHTAYRRQGQMCIRDRWWPGVGHQYARGARQQTLDCFIASTKRLPEYDAERDAVKKAMGTRDFAGAWSLIRKRALHEDKDNEGILGKVHRLYLESLEDEVDRIDRMAEREVRQIVRDHEDPQQRREALEKHRAKFAGAAKTGQAIDKALEQID